MKRRNFIQFMVALGSTVPFVTKAQEPDFPFHDIGPRGLPKVEIDHEAYDKAWSDFTATGLQREEFQMLSAKLLSKFDDIFRLDYELSIATTTLTGVDGGEDTFFYKGYVYHVAYYTEYNLDKNNRIVVEDIKRQTQEEYDELMAFFNGNKWG